MKYIVIACLLVFVSSRLEAQSPLSFNYQALALDNNNRVISNEIIDVEIAILIGSPTGTEVFREGHQVETSKHGIFSLQVGEGQMIYRSLANINWSSGAYWIQTEADLDFDGSLEVMGTSPLVSVPFALHATTVDNADDADADPQNEIQILQRNGDTISLTQGGGQFIDQTRDDDDDPLNEIQTISKVGDFIELSYGGGSIMDEVDDADADPQNEIQNLSVNQNGVIVELGIDNGTGVTFSTSDDDADPLNELQTIEIRGDSLAITKGNAIKLPTGNGLWSQRGDSVFINNNGSAIVESQNGILSTEVSIYGIACQDGHDQSFLSPRTFFIAPNQFNDSMSMSIWSDGINMLKDSSGGVNTLVNLSKNKLQFHGAGNGTYGKNQLSFGDSLALVPTLSYMDAYATEFTNGDNTAFMNPFGVSFNSTLKQSLLTNSSLYLFGGPDIFDIRLDWSMEADSLRAFNNNGTRTVKLGNNPLTNSGELVLRAQYDNDRLFYIGDLFAQGTAIMAMYNSNENRILTVAGDAGASTYYGQNGSENVTLGFEDATPNRGKLSVHNVLGDAVVTGGVDISNNGYINIREQGTSSGITIETDSIMLHGLTTKDAWKVKSSSPYANTAQMFINGEGQHPNIYLGYDRQNNNPRVGELKIYDQDGSSPLTFHGNGTINGRSIIVRNQNGNSRMIIENNQAYDAGEISIYGPNGNLNVSAGVSNQVFTNDGGIQVHDANGIAQAGIYTDNGLGYFYADVKNFRVDHPEDPNKEIWYASLEGPEAAAYVRGQAQLSNGEAFVPFPHHFYLIANPKDMTVILTPQEWDTFGLAVVEKTPKGIYVKELKGGKGNFHFDWEVKCVRKGHEDFQVERPRP